MNNIVKKALVWLGALLVLVTVLAIGLMLYLTNPQFANTKLVVGINRFLFLNSTNPLKSIPGLSRPDIITTVIVKENGKTSSSYLYSIQGKFDKIDIVRNLIYIRTSNNQVYSFSPRIYDDGSMVVSNQLADKSFTVLKIMPTDLSEPLGITPIVDLNRPLVFQWEDQRKLTEINEDLKYSPDKTVNTNSTNSDFRRIIFNLE